MRIIHLAFVKDRSDIRNSMALFNAEAEWHYELARSLLRQTSYWIYDPVSNNFGPSKFVGFRSMNFSKYALCRDEMWSGATFDGHATRRAIEEILGKYKKDSRFADQLQRWGDKLLEPDVFEDLKKEKWKFNSL